MTKTVNIALQVLPTSTTVHPYLLVDKAIEVIEKSGLRYKVTPFETVMEGSYDEIMEVVKLAQEACYEAGGDTTGLPFANLTRIDKNVRAPAGRYLRRINARTDYE